MHETNLLQQYFPMIRTQEEILREINNNPSLQRRFWELGENGQKELIDFCSGIRGVKMLYDGIFKENFSPEIHPERLEDLLSEIFGRKVRIKAVLPNDGPRLGMESALIYTDIIVELENGSLANVEVQRIGFSFPGERSACYSADHLLRQYKKLRSQKGKKFTYRDIKTVYTIVFFEHSTKAMHAISDTWIHHFSQKSDSGLEMNLLQEYYFVSLDIFRKNMENKGIETKLEAWLSFLSFDEPERIIDLISMYPEFKELYWEIYRMCQNTEKVLEVCSMELWELDRNTIQYMMEEMQEELEEKRAELEGVNAELAGVNAELKEKNEEIMLKNQRIKELEKLLAEKENHHR